MPCELHDEAWPAVLEARRLLANGLLDLAFIARANEWRCTAADGADFSGANQVLFAGEGAFDLPVGPRVTIYRPNAVSPPTLEHPTDAPIDVAMQTFARVYLPVLLGSAAARADNRVFVAAHVTQTLDGRIACTNGQSQWIGNDEDMRHAHRMRALLDGVLVGAGTVAQDDPLLTVRHVDGPNPRRLVLSGSGRSLRERQPRQVFDPPGCLVIVRNDAEVSHESDHVEVVGVQQNGAEGLPPALVLEALSQNGIHSIYLEGGARTLSSFFAASAIDLLQVHIASMVLGSGMPSFSLPVVEHVRDGRPMVMDHASLQGHLLLTCWPQQLNT